MFKAGQKKKELELLQRELRNMLVHNSLNKLEFDPKFKKLKTQINEVRKEISELRKDVDNYVHTNSEYINYRSGNQKRNKLVAT